MSITDVAELGRTHQHKRPRDENVGDDASVVAPVTPTTESAVTGTVPPNNNSTTMMKLLVPMYPRPMWSMAPWQVVAVSVTSQIKESNAFARSLNTSHITLQRDLVKFARDRQLHTRKFQMQQRDAANRIGKSLFNSMKQHWSAAGKLHHQLLRVEYEFAKRSQDESKQDDLLKETEDLTKNLLARMISDRRNIPADKPFGAHVAAAPGGGGDDVDVAEDKKGKRKTAIAVRRMSTKRGADGEPLAADNSQSTTMATLVPTTTMDGNGDNHLAPSSTTTRTPTATGSIGSEATSSSSSTPPVVVDDALQLLQQASDNTAPFEQQLRLLDTQNGDRPLRDYQRSALRWMLHLYSQGLNGILADEMGLGKTVQTLALIAYFAEYKNDWGPHLIIVPTTVVLNWAAECKRWCPAFKVLTYIGSAKERLALRHGWTGEDAFHICITTYNIVINDRIVFRRRPWGLLVLDEAHHIKNFASLKWRALFDLQAQHRLMLTGTPLQNSVMELWSLFHFLLPFASAFQSEGQFRDWFSNPMNDMVQGSVALNEDVIRRLQALLRPFLLRRLKRDVESQLPTKTEKVLLCRLSIRQRALYDEFIQRSDTQHRLKHGGGGGPGSNGPGGTAIGGIFGILLQLRKVCNHPELFAERPTRSPFIFSMPWGAHKGATIHIPACVALTNSSGSRRRRVTLNAAFLHNSCIVEDLCLPSTANNDDEEVPLVNVIATKSNDSHMRGWLECVIWDSWVPLLPLNGFRSPAAVAVASSRTCPQDLQRQRQLPPRGWAPTVRKGTPSSSSLQSMLTAAAASLTQTLEERRDRQARVWHSHEASQEVRLWARGHLLPAHLCAHHVQSRPILWSVHQDMPRVAVTRTFPALVPTVEERWGHWTTQQVIERVCVVVPAARCVGGLQLAWEGRSPPPSLTLDRFRPLDVAAAASLFAAHLDKMRTDVTHPFSQLCATTAYRNNVPRTNAALRGSRATPVPASSCRFTSALWGQEGWNAHVRRTLTFPEKRLLIHDCGKFQVLEPLMKSLRAQGHRALIFTQFTKMLDLLEKFLSHIGITYLRIDGSTQPVTRQLYVDTFNATSAITSMILSTRSGGIGLNLTGADTVIFYDSDWNPTIDLQAQDRCHRIGQTRPVTIYRLISEHTVEEKILDKARERKMLNNVVIRGGQFHSIADVGASEQPPSSSSTTGESSDTPSVASAYAAIMSTAVSLRSFFHDLDEDADIAPPQQSSSIFSGGGGEPGTDDMTMIDESAIRNEMANAEDDEDREALKAVTHEIQEQQDATARDELDMEDDESRTQRQVGSPTTTEGGVGVGAGARMAGDGSATQVVPGVTATTINTPAVVNLINANPKTQTAKLQLLRNHRASYHHHNNNNKKSGIRRNHKLHETEADHSVNVSKILPAPTNSSSPGNANNVVTIAAPRMSTNVYSDALAVQNMALTYHNTHPQHVVRQSNALEEHFGLTL